jgi:hypothetical protein
MPNALIDILGYLTGHPALVLKGISYLNDRVEPVKRVKQDGTSSAQNSSALLTGRTDQTEQQKPILSKRGREYKKIMKTIERKGKNWVPPLKDCPEWIESDGSNNSEQYR